MNFILKMAWRDSRTSRRRLSLFSLSIALGIAALVAIGSFGDNLRRAIDEQARGLLGADLAISSRLALPDDAKACFAGLGRERAEEISFRTMVVFPAGGGKTRLVSLRALEGAYPFYGDLVTEPSGAMAELRAAGSDAAILDEALLAQFGAKAGDPVRLGRTTFRVAGALKKIPGESAAVAMLSPRVYIPMARLEDTGLVGAGSLVRYKTFFRLAPGTEVEPLVRELSERFGGLRLGYDTVERRKRELGRALQNVYSFLSLVGFIAVFLGAIGVASAIHAHVRQKIATVAVLRCLGASARQSFAVYLVQGLALGVFGSVVGAALGVAIQLGVPALIRDLVPFEVEFSVSWLAVARGVGAGLGVCVLFTLLPLLAVRRVSPLAALRAGVSEDKGGFDVWRGILYATIVAAVVGFAVWQTRSWGMGLAFAAGLGVSFGALTGLARVVAWSARRFLPKKLPYVWRQGVANLYRPNNRTVLLLLSLGLGTFLLLTLALARESLLREIAGAGGGNRPNLMFFDIQDDQIEPLNRVLVREGAPAAAQAPVVTMRIRSINGRDADELLRAADRQIPGWTLRREYRSTFRATLSATERIVAGTFDGQATGGLAVTPVSVERGLAEEMKLKLGDELEWDVQGVTMRTRITSLREVDWHRLQPNFFVVFPEGVLEAAPKFFLLAARVETPADSARVQQAVVGEFPNVSAIDLAAILQTLDTIFSKAELVVRFMALFTVGTGAVVLVGAVLAGRFQRLRETVLLRTLGASRRQLVQIQLVEYAVLGVLAAVTGALLAVAAHVVLAEFLLKTSPVVPFRVLALAVAGVSALTLVTGLFVNRGLVRHSPLEVLRHETG